MILNSGNLILSIHDETGALISLTDSKQQTVWCDNPQAVPFVLEYEQNHFSGSFASFRSEPDQDGIKLIWITEDGTEINAQVKAAANGFSFSSSVQPASGTLVCSLEYPILEGLAPPAACKDSVAHAYATGFQVDEPSKNFTKENPGFRHMPYPESFSGSSMQFFAYYFDNGKGLYFAAKDGGFHQKWLNFYHTGDGLRASQIYGYEHLGAGKKIAADWEFEIRSFHGDWYDACDLYREWALGQPWCGRGPRRNRPDEEKPVWLFEQTGAATFGINAMHDRSKWLHRYHKDIKTPMFHMTGPDWANEPQTFGRGVPGGYDDWFPTHFHEENKKAARQYGDHFAPFEFDFLIATDKADKDVIPAHLQCWPEKPKSYDAYTFTMLCPTEEYTKELHVKRDLRVSQESGCDAMYYDISCNNILHTCMSADHRHDCGGGEELSKAYREIFHATRDALTKDRGRYIPLGTEMMNEIYIDMLDFYQARANGQPCSSLETWPYRKLIRAGKARTVPMFQYVYSGYAPLRMDGWGKLVEEVGDQIYHTIAKTYLWGGLFEINSEYSPMEVVDSAGENSGDEHYAGLVPRGFAYDERVGKYIGRFAALRTGPFGKYLAYGTMRKPLRLRCRSINRTYYMYNHSAKAGETGDHGIISLPAVVTSHYELDGKTVLLFANTTAFTETCEVTVPQEWNGSVWNGIEDYVTGAEAVKPFAIEGLQSFTLRPYQLTVLCSQE